MGEKDSILEKEIPNPPKYDEGSTQPLNTNIRARRNLR